MNHRGKEDREDARAPEAPALPGNNLNDVTGDKIKLSEIVFTRAQGQHLRSGILFWVRATVNDWFRVDNLTIRKTALGEIRLTYSARKDSSDREHPHFRFLDPKTHRAFEREVFAAIGIKETAGT